MAQYLVSVGDDMALPAEVQALVDTKAAAQVAALAAQMRVPLAAVPEQLMTGTRTFNASGMILASTVTWPDGTSGSYAGTADPANAAWTRSYTITYERTGAQRTYTQPAMTRNAAGVVTVRPALTVT